MQSQDEKEEYVPRRILVTGGAGFIGSHVVRRLLAKQKYQVIVLDALTECSSMMNLDDVKDHINFSFVRGDIKSMDLVSHILEKANIDTVMHFAAHTHVDASFGNSVEFTMNNTVGTHVLLEACRKHGGIQRIINVSTDEVYGSEMWNERHEETSRLEPTNPYSAAKAGAEMVAHAYYTSYKLPIITTRGNNVYGPGQFPEKLIPKLILRAHMGEKMPLHGNGSAARSYLHVDDVAAAFETVLHRGVPGQIYNIGTTLEKTNLEVAYDICRLFHLDPTEQITHVKDRLFNDRRYFVSSDKLTALGWEPRITWVDGLRTTAMWYIQNASNHWKSADVNAALQSHQTK
jgi:UDP-glucose 4,6-dehydratase